MARHQPTTPPQLALFDRLLQGDNIETDRSADSALRELRDSVRRDLEILFNTRPMHRPYAPWLSELQHSIVTFGLPSLQGQHLGSFAQKEQFRIYLENLIQRTETRFRELTVELIEQEGPLERTLRLQIQAVLETDSISEVVVFDTTVDPITGGFVVQER